MKIGTQVRYIGTDKAYKGCTGEVMPCGIKNSIVVSPDPAWREANDFTARGILSIPKVWQIIG
jgi:hypothetical protein